MPFASVTAVVETLAAQGYVADEALATTVFVAQQLQKPILAEGPAGVGKTELAKALALALGTSLVRVQCYEGLDESKTLYEWKYAKQILYTQLLRDKIGAVVSDAETLADAVDSIAVHEDVFFSERFLQPRPLLEAIASDTQVVLLIDEVDRAEDELEAFFLEVLAEFQVTVPELGTIKAKHPPAVILTSNNTRELSDALRRRCLYLPMTYPDRDREAAIVRARVPDAPEQLSAKLAAFVDGLRQLELKKPPSVSETIDWARALLALDSPELNADSVRDTLNVLVKHRGDLEVAQEQTLALLARAK